MLTDGARRRRIARGLTMTVLVICALAGTVPAAIELSRQGFASWTSTEPFLENLSDDSDD